MTETDSMVVRVARSVCIALGREPECWADSEQLRDRCRVIARAAIEAMKEPTPVVLEEGYDKLDFYDEQSDAADKFNREVVERVWSAMIRKALEE